MPQTHVQLNLYVSYERSTFIMKLNTLGTLNISHCKQMMCDLYTKKKKSDIEINKIMNGPYRYL